MLAVKIENLGNRSFFNAPASPEAIENLEKEANIKLPDNLKKFYLHFNGGFFAREDWSEEYLTNKEIFGDIRWNSNYILSIEDMLICYNYGDCDFVLFDIRERGKNVGKKLLPFLHTQGQEMLVIDLSDTTKDTPIIDADHEVNSDEWAILYPSFEVFLSHYVDKDGDIETIASLSY